ncbi:hypothetical protein MASR2M29_13250 [Spirochaetota bacterium]
MAYNSLKVIIGLGSGGQLLSASADGHAGSSPKGENLACAAVTVLLRTAYETISAYPGVKIKGKAEKPGSLDFKISAWPEEMAERLRAVADFLVVGLSGINREFPGLLELVIDQN